MSYTNKNSTLEDLMKIAIKKSKNMSSKKFKKSIRSITLQNRFVKVLNLTLSIIPLNITIEELDERFIKNMKTN